MPTDHYEDFVDEAYIKPIRSVVIIDDDYPTYDEVLTPKAKEEVALELKAWKKNPERIRSVIRRFRGRTPPLLVDIHDGTNVDAEREAVLTSNLHQSDLLVLDFQLDPSKENDGTAAIDILRKSISNDHFNLVVVYTSHDLDQVFYDVLTGLVGIASEISPPETGVRDLEELVAAVNERIEGFETRLFASMDREAYFDYRGSTDRSIGRMLTGGQPYAAFKAACDEAEWTPRQRKSIFRYVLADIQNRLSDKMDPDCRVQLNWSSDMPYWIQSNTIFVAFSNKSDSEDLIGDLKGALNAWHPEPSRLLLGKLRADFHERGVSAQAPVLTNKRALTLWYQRLLESDENLCRQYVAEVVSRHSDQAMGNILPSVEDFTQRLIDAERSMTTDYVQLCSRRFRVDLSNSAERAKARLEHNAFVCTQAPCGRHLTTGHIFEAFDDRWICLSPACDLVPTQIGAAQSAVLGAWMPFMAVKLHPVANAGRERDRDGINSGRYVFIRRDQDGIECFRFTDHSNSVPEWRLIFARDGGIFDGGGGPDGCLQFNAALTVVLEEGTLGPKHGCARIVGQLRYEYALNLLVRLGGSLSRIGLGFLAGEQS